MKKINILVLILIFIPISTYGDIYYSFLSDNTQTEMMKSDINWVKVGEEYFIWSQNDYPNSKHTTKNLYLLKHKNPLDLSLEEVLFDKNGFAILLLEDGEYQGWKSKENAFIRIEEIPVNEVIYSKYISKEKPKSETDTETVETLIESLSQQNYGDYLLGLTNFPTRYTYSENFSNVTDWVEDRFTYMGYLPKLDLFEYNGNTYNNVIAQKIGSVSPDDWYIICGHYDSTSNDPMNNAPGGDDNGSGAAGVLETARVLKDIETEASVLFIAFGAEEQGMIGSKAYVADLKKNGDLSKVKAVLNMDMIGYLNSGKWDILLEGEPVSEWMINIISDTVTEYSLNLIVETSLIAWGSDHEPFLNEGVPAVLLIEHEYDENPNYHRTTDTYNTVTQPYAMEVLKMNIAALAAMNKFTLQAQPTPTQSLSINYSVWKLY